MEALDELQSKYNKLATEYSKLRSQIPVLKKAFTEEQSKNISLCEELKLKDQQLRIAESEADSLNFRNQQLMCRVTVLQDELEALQTACKKDAKMKHFDGPQFLHNFDEELSKKVAENATLIFTLNEYKERHELEVKALKDEIESLKLRNSFTEEEFSRSDQVVLKGHNSSNNQKNMIGETIQKALEKQLFETQQTLQETIVERDRLKQKIKMHEENFKNGFMDFGDNESDQIDTFHHFSSLLDETNDSVITDSENDTHPSLLKESMLRENAIKRCYRLRSDKLISESVKYKSKAESFEGECTNLKVRLEDEVVKRKTLEEQLEKERQNSTSAKEELSTTAENYEIQLSTMSDHLAGLNDIIEEQKGQLYNLQTELQKHVTSSKVKK